MDWKREWKPFAWIVAAFLIFFYLPIESSRLKGAVMEALALTKWYAQEHVITCLVPAFFIAGAIAVFVSQSSVMKYLGAEANKVLSYGVASVSGTILTVCSCTVLPLFAGIYRTGGVVVPGRILGVTGHICLPGVVLSISERAGCASLNARSGHRTEGRRKAGRTRRN